MERSEKKPYLETTETKTVFTAEAPASESLLNHQLESPWPESVRNNPELEAQAEARKEVIMTVKEAFSFVPDATMSFGKALQKGKISEEDLIELYTHLANFLKAPENRRLILYLPFELLPDEGFKAASAELVNAAQELKEAYKQAWEEMLYVQDVRANFVDGDVPEIGQASNELPRVSKVAHFLPWLIQKGYFTKPQVKQMIKEHNGSPVEQGLKEGLVAYESLTHQPESESAEERPLRLQEVQVKLDKEIKSLNMQGAESVTPARASWLKSLKLDGLLDKTADNLVISFRAGEVDFTELPNDFFKQPYLEVVVVKTLRKIIESKAAINLIEAKSFFDQSSAIFSKVKSQEATEELASALSRLYSLGVVSKELLEKNGVHEPKIEVDFGEKRPELEEDLKLVEKILREIEIDPELNKIVGPAAILYGSKVKGYGKRTADIDVAVFIKTTVPEEAFSNIKQKLAEKFSHEKIGGKVLQFWLKKEDPGLGIKNIAIQDASLGRRDMSHVLFQGVWIGNYSAIKQLYERLLSQYLYEQNSEKRKTWLEEIERDTVQYRLLHKGYDRLYAPKAKPSPQLTKEIDGPSSFWDPGFRRLATKLYLQKVFLPKLERPKNKI